MSNVQISEDSIVPRKASYGSPAYDVCSKKKVTILPKSITKIDFGMKIKIPEGYFLQLTGRSGLAYKGIFTVPEIIDSNWLNPVQALMYNSTDTPFTISKGQRISQCYLQPTHDINWNYVDQVKEPNPRNPHTGFGSTSHICERYTTLFS